MIPVVGLGLLKPLTDPGPGPDPEGIDAADVTYTPAEPADWGVSPPPDDVAEALDLLAAREEGSGGGGNFTFPLVVGSDLAAGDFVALDPITLEAVKSDASDSELWAIGFVTEAYLTGATATINESGVNTALTGLVPGTIYVIDHTTPGSVIPYADAPATIGYVLQIVGYALTSTTMFVKRELAILRG